MQKSLKKKINIVYLKKKEKLNNKQNVLQNANIFFYYIVLLLDLVLTMHSS